MSEVSPFSVRSVLSSSSENLIQPSCPPSSTGVIVNMAHHPDINFGNHVAPPNLQHQQHLLHHNSQQHLHAVGLHGRQWSHPSVPLVSHHSKSSLVSDVSRLSIDSHEEDVADLTPVELEVLISIRRRKQELLKEIEQLKDEISTITNEMTKLDAQDSGKMTCKQKQMTIGKKRFNMDPKKGLEFLFEQGLVKNTPEDVAAFLYKGEGLNKTAIGEFLGDKKDFNLQVLDAFVNLHDFGNLILVEALRRFLWSFRLPGEAQKIDRMMEKFAGRYCAQNAGVFSDNDTCYVLCFSIIMLNTALHNPSVKEKTTLEQFISMNRGINNGENLPRELLISLYESIKQEPFKIPEDDGNDLMHTFFNNDREGWLWKQGGRYKSWKRRWFILNDKCLYYFEYTTDKEPRGIIPLEDVQVRQLPDKIKPNGFELFSSRGPGEVIKACKTDADGRVIEGKHTCYRMYSATAEDRDAWIKAICTSISHNPYLDMLAARKRKTPLF